MKKFIRQIASIISSVIVLLFVVGIFAYASLKLPSKQEADMPQYLIVFPFKTTHMQGINAIIQAKGLPVRTGSFDFLLIAASENPNFAKDIRKQGASFIFSPIIKGGCLIQRDSTRS